MKRKLFCATLVAVMLVVSISLSAFAASRKYSNWFDLDRINAIDVETDLRDEADREEVALLIAELCDNLNLLPSSSTLDFEDERDFSSSYAYKMITRLSSTGIVCGYPDGEFKPENPITRAEDLAMILRMIDYFSLETHTYNRGSYFTDTEGHWAEVYCQRAYEEGLVSGRGNGRFYPDDEITREETITILVNLMGESNNPLIKAIDKIYNLIFANAYYEEKNDNYYNNNRYDDYYGNDNRYDNEYEEATKRPVVNTGSSNSSNSTPTNNTNKPERPVVDTTTSSSTTVSRPVVDTTTSSSTTVSRPVVDTTTTTSTAVERPVVDTTASASTAPVRPTF